MDEDFVAKSAREWREERKRRGFPDEPPPKAKAYANGSGAYAGEEPIRPFDTINAASWHGKPVPHIEFLDQRQMLPIGHASLLTGAPKVGKTFVALSAAISCVAGTNWLNEPIRQGPVIFYSAEETIDVLHMRIARICEKRMIELSALGDLHIIDLSQIVNAALIMGDNRTESVKETALYDRLDMSMAAIRPVLTWIDNKGLVVTGNENSRSITAGSARAIMKLADRHRCAVGMLMHPSLTGMANKTGSSGSTANFGGYRSVIHMTRPENEEDKSVRLLECEATNHAVGDVAVNLRWDWAEFDCTDMPKRAGDDIGQHDKDERLFLRLLDYYISIGQEVSPNSKAGDNYAPKLFSGHKEAARTTPRRFRNAMDALLFKKQIAIDHRGSPSKRVAFLIHAVSS